MKPENRPKIEFEGKEYDDYQATQMQRKIERTIRRKKREVAACEAAGLTDEAAAAKSYLRRLNQEYRDFSRAAGLPEQRERMKALYGDDASAKKTAKALEKSSDSGIIGLKQLSGVPGVNKVCDLAIETYKCITPDIRTSEVIITDERIGHIQERHPDDFERYAGYLKEIVESPDYILEANKPNTAFILKEIEDAGERFQLILRLAVSDDPIGYKNSIITFLKVEEKRYLRYLRTKKILYKSE